MRFAIRPNDSLRMNQSPIAALAALAIALVPASATAQAVKRGDRAILDVAQTLKPGQFVWAPELTGEGPALVIVNLETQRLVMFRNGVPIAASTISSGAPGHETPTGVFSILQKREEHYSKTYDNAPMPNMQRLTWKGIALHAGKLPGYPASHGCIRLPLQFSKLLFGQTELGMTVVIAHIPIRPQDSGEPLAANPAGPQASFSKASYQWNPPATASYDPLSVVVSAADQKAVVIQDGKEIGSAPVRVNGDLQGGTAYVLKSWDDSGKHWLKLRFSGAGGTMDVGPEELKRFDAPDAFRAALAAAVRPGSVVIVTPESLKAGSAGESTTVLADETAK